MLRRKTPKQPDLSDGYKGRMISCDPDVYLDCRPSNPAWAELERTGAIRYEPAVRRVMIAPELRDICTALETQRPGAVIDRVPDPNAQQPTLPLEDSPITPETRRPQGPHDPRLG
jgi:hypothetical protein